MCSCQQSKQLKASPKQTTHNIPALSSSALGPSTFPPPAHPASAPDRAPHCERPGGPTPERGNPVAVETRVGDLRSSPGDLLGRSCDSESEDEHDVFVMFFFAKCGCIWHRSFIFLHQYNTWRYLWSFQLVCILQHYNRSNRSNPFHIIVE